MKIKFTADSTCDLSRELLDRYDISIIGMTIIKNDEAFTDGVTITPEDVFAHVAAGGDLCSTSAASVGEYIDHFAQFASDYDTVIHVGLGSGFSACYQNACLAAEEFDNVQVIDSRNLCNAYGLVLLKACELVQSGMSIEEMKTVLEDFIPRLEMTFLVDKLDYLVKGGRCSAVAAMGASLLNIKPCLEVRDNKLIVAKKYRGSFEKCLNAWAKERLTDRDDLDGGWLIIPRTTHTIKESEMVMGIAQESGNFTQMHYCYAGCTISCHCGPDALGLAFVRK